ncbi:hypothetical protein DXX93_00795 [Thalassotalea euphylliae]|uniref:Thioredoxin domain-containing protein n=1 Tax=Thalassotalea euphylliae TaxID=1655234 RepID=A0A3E0TLL9_9GAMM|nr:hypothetical protein [Thalassotalea euphylliae]REL25237.1 hypothetical protein DXX93_00795 [Thalassotalea euphylliae]
MQTDVRNKPEMNSQNSVKEVAKTSQNGNGRKHFVMVCIAFLLPVILAKMALEQQWFNYGVTNQGQLLATPVSLSQLSLTDIQTDKHWLMVFNVPTPCEKACQKSVNALSNTYLALGKEMPRVQAVLLNYSTAHASTNLATASGKNNELEIHISRWQQFTVPALTHPELQHGKVFIVDPLGNVVMTHQPPQAADALPAFGKAILADMKKLLKYSRIG